MWLRDALPKHLADDNDASMARIMTYGYKSHVPDSDSFQNLDDLALSLKTHLLRLAHAKTMKPIFFVAHSLGGLVLKQVWLSDKPVQ